MNPPNAPSAVPRRGFLSFATFLLGGALAALASIPVLGSAFGPVLRPRARDEAEPLPVADIKDLFVGIPKRVELSSTARDAWSREDGRVLGAAWLVKQKDGSVQAFSSVCPHLGCGIRFEAAKKSFACPCHDSNFSLEGAATGGPSPRGMDALEVTVREQTVFLRYARFKQGTKNRQEL